MLYFVSDPPGCRPVDHPHPGREKAAFGAKASSEVQWGKLGLTLTSLIAMGGTIGFWP